VAQVVNPRRYDSRRRQASAAQTRLSVLRAARDLFAKKGYAATSVADIARAAGVSVDTLYEAVGRKPQLLLAVHDMELARADDPVEAAQRDYVVQIRAAATAAEKIALYAEALARVLPKAGPLLLSLHDAGRTDPECAAMYRRIVERRAANMRQFAADLRATGELRTDLDDDAVADLVWSMNAPEYFRLLESRGFTPARYAALVREVWSRTLLR
jgi:AcrR family transcriptional regulator